jgi:ketosteroid isomerase-like protein
VEPLAAETAPVRDPRSTRAARRAAAAAAASAAAAGAGKAPATQADAVAAAAVEPDSRQLRQVDANRLLNRFSRAYEQGDLDGMRALFAVDVRGRGGNRDAILAEYDRLFGNSEERSLQVRDVSWFGSGDTLTIIASFDATVTSTRDKRQRRTRGDLRLDLRREDTQWRIVRLQHEERRG